MKRYKVIAFDLDGTLSDPELGQLTGFEYAFKKHGIVYKNRDFLKKYIGPPIHNAWRDDFGLSPDAVERLIETYREYYNIYGWRENRLYEGVPEMLSALRAAGYRLVVATSKPEGIAKKIISLFGLLEYFDFVGGAAEDSSRHLKEDVLRYALSAVGADPSDALLVGDRKFDAEGARAVGCASLGVTWGHGSREELENAGFSAIAGSPKEVVKYISLCSI